MQLPLEDVIQQVDNKSFGLAALLALRSARP